MEPEELSLLEKLRTVIAAQAFVLHTPTGTIDQASKLYEAGEYINPEGQQIPEPVLATSGGNHFVVRSADDWEMLTSEELMYIALILPLLKGVETHAASVAQRSTIAKDRGLRILSMVLSTHGRSLLAKAVAATKRPGTA